MRTLYTRPEAVQSVQFTREIAEQSLLDGEPWPEGFSYWHAQFDKAERTIYSCVVTFQLPSMILPARLSLDDCVVVFPDGRFEVLSAGEVAERFQEVA